MVHHGGMDEAKLLQRITVSPKIFAGKPTLRGRRLAVEQVLGLTSWNATDRCSRIG